MCIKISCVGEIPSKRVPASVVTQQTEVGIPEMRNIPHEDATCKISVQFFRDKGIEGRSQQYDVPEVNLRAST